MEKNQLSLFFKDDNAEKLRKAIKKSKRGSKELKGYGAEIRLKSLKCVQLIDAVPLTAWQLSQNRLRDGKDLCKKPKCLDEVAAIERAAHYVNGLWNLK